MSATRRLAAILAADVAGYSRLMGADEAGTAQALREHRAAADPLVAAHGGRIVKTTGDGVLIEFGSVVGAVECALALQQLAAERNSGVPGERRMEWRIGIHLGDVLVEGDDILGDGVNIAARLEGIAEPGGICISEDAFRQVRGKVAAEFADIGEQRLKNIAGTLRVYRVRDPLTHPDADAPGSPLSRIAQGCPGKPGGESISRRRMPRKTAVFRLLSGLQDSERGRGMRFTPSIFGKLLEPIKRRQFETLVEHHAGDAYVKSFTSWNHLLALVYAQFSSAVSLRGLEAGWNANSQHHYHLGSGPLVRSTLADANKRRPVAVFAETFSLVASQLDRQTRRDGTEMVKLIDSTPIPLGKLCDWAKSNGRIRGLKMHVVFDPKADYPSILDITDANVNDAQIGRTITIEPGATYVFDKGYCHYGWWTAIADKGAVFITRPKTNMRLDIVGERPIAFAQGDGFTCSRTVRWAWPARAIRLCPSHCAGSGSSEPTGKPSPC
jgi:class 3 adenylate cyclase